MSRRIVVAATSEGDLRLKELWEQDGCPDDDPVWPTRHDLDAVIRAQAAEHHWTVIGVDGPPCRRGPLLVERIDAATGERYTTAVWQLHTYVQVAA